MIDANPLSELTAMDATYACLWALDATECRRVIAWARACFVEHPASYVLVSRDQPLGCNCPQPDDVRTLEQEQAEEHMPDQPAEMADITSPSLTSTDDLPTADRDRPSSANEGELVEPVEPQQPVSSKPDDLNSLFEAVSPKTGLAKALLCAWWLETREAASSWSLQDIAETIEGVGRQAQRLSTILGIELRKPQPLIMTLPTAEDGQHERYALTDAGRAFVESLLASAS